MEYKALSGRQVAADMNKRFLDTRDSCGDQPAYYCNGILIRAANASPNYHAWDPSPGSVENGGISFSYLRADLNTTRMQGARKQGFTMKAGKDGASAELPLTLLCSFPYDGGTLRRADKGCGKSTSMAGSEQCERLNIDTIDKWLKHFTFYKVEENRYRHRCSFDVVKDKVALSLEARRISDPDEQLTAWSQNEVVVATWPAGKGEKLPLESFFYIPDTKMTERGNLYGLAGARAMQLDYYQQTGIVIPVIRMSFDKNPEEVFSWRQEDQAVTEIAKNYSIPASVLYLLTNTGNRIEKWVEAGKISASSGLPEGSVAIAVVKNKSTGEEVDKFTFINTSENLSADSWPHRLAEIINNKNSPYLLAGELQSNGEITIIENSCDRNKIWLS